MSTLTLPPVPPHPKDDAIQLYKAFKGFGCDDSAVINVLAHRDATQRAYIQQEFRTMYSEDLLKRLTKELSGKLETAVLLWMHDPAGRDAIILKQSLTVTKILEAATEVICSRTPSQLQHLRQIYHSRFGVFLEHDIERHTSGDHKKILLAYVTTPRHEGPEVNREIAENDAKALYKAGEKKLGTDEKTFVQILSERSAAHLAAVSFAYQHKHGHSLEKAVKKETSGLFALALKTIIQCSENPAKYFAKVLRKAMKGLGTNDETLIRVIVTRTEIDLQYIKAEYLKKYKKTLHDAVHSETSGHYRAFLLSLIGPNH
ncbi:PREDICTED: annexin D5-like isoform X1 [Lupinus angustifolius]|uniref:annexin D5-like isoform X1 n=1 Tax=Lupinus angustifolius TaxID=3871 RepID=UPI00092F449D|nr:PREDICTED: annexin D5-like isoform X1 [Lupinus angustifolius]